MRETQNSSIFLLRELLMSDLVGLSVGLERPICEHTLPWNTVDAEIITKWIPQTIFLCNGGHYTN